MTRKNKLFSPQRCLERYKLHHEKLESFFCRQFLRFPYFLNTHFSTLKTVLRILKKSFVIKKHFKSTFRQILFCRFQKNSLNSTFSCKNRFFKWTFNHPHQSYSRLLCSSRWSICNWKGYIAPDPPKYAPWISSSVA